MLMHKVHLGHAFRKINHHEACEETDDNDYSVIPRKVCANHAGLPHYPGVLTSIHDPGHRKRCRGAPIPELLRDILHPESIIVICVTYTINTSSLAICQPKMKNEDLNPIFT